ncbi:MAG TPA: bifunctional UDP-N-acetylglucosamine diphosphorylase/glucosamine-1-phosphate N-acetyltransferase GlmU [Anaerolineales bacterium]|nr:bifunctional UDP-N-acetylglucosamine diphosphorylase/glucosamine-1-phosphate N-acetyltransferase GlmU [Anaerolineales bacterium]
MILSVVILAAGQGTRMKSNLPKVLHRLGGRPLVQYAIDTARAVSDRPPILVVGHSGEQVRAALGEQCDYVTQAEQLGTAHAVLQVRDLLASRGGRVLVCYADMPLIPAGALNAIAHSPSPVALLTFTGPEPRGFGRIARDSNGKVIAIVEEDQATPEQKDIRELNPGVYCFDSEFLWRELARLPVSPRGEYFLTDLIGVAVKQGLPVDAVPLADPDDAIGINNRVHLAEAETILRRRINRRWMEAGVTMVDPSTVYIEPTVTLGPDTLLWPNVQLLGNTIIGSACELGPNTQVRDSTLGDECVVTASVIENAKVEDRVLIGPYAHLRKGAHLASGVHLGNFGEVKESYLGPGVKMGHFSYIGDARVGANANIGAGTITCNFDGTRKNPTTIGDDVFIGSDTLLVAPIVLGDRSRTGAGSVVTKDVPPDSLAVGLPARVIRKFEKESP